MTLRLNKKTIEYSIIAVVLLLLAIAVYVMTFFDLNLQNERVDPEVDSTAQLTDSEKLALSYESRYLNAEDDALRATSLLGLAVTAAEQGQYDSAIVFIDEALAFGTFDNITINNAYLRKAEYQAKQNDFASAVATLEALQSNGTLEGGRYDLQTSELEGRLQAYQNNQQYTPPISGQCESGQEC